MQIKIIIFLCFVGVVFGSCLIEEEPELALQRFNVNFKDYVEGYSYIATGSNGYQNPSITTLAIFSQFITYLLEANYKKASANAAILETTLYEVTDTDSANATYYCMIPNNSYQLGRGIFCIQPASSRENHIAAPHPVFDGQTPSVAVDIYRGSSFRYLSISTTHRCANSTFSSCDGTTTVCGASESYRTSDAAHTVNSFFDQWSRQLSDYNSGTITVQIHGCGSASCPAGTGSDVVTRSSVGTTTDLAANTISNLFNDDIKARVQAVKASATTQSCNLVGDQDILCATTNTQGRYINGSTSDPCGDSATPDASSRFLHIEASSDIRNDSGGSDEINPQMLVDSLNSVM